MNLARDAPIASKAKRPVFSVYRRNQAVLNLKSRSSRVFRSRLMLCTPAYEKSRGKYDASRLHRLQRQQPQLVGRAPVDHTKRSVFHGDGSQRVDTGGLRRKPLARHKLGGCSTGYDLGVSVWLPVRLLDRGRNGRGRIHVEGRETNSGNRAFREVSAGRISSPSVRRWWSPRRWRSWWARSLLGLLRMPSGSERSSIWSCLALASCPWVFRYSRARAS